MNVPGVPRGEKRENRAGIVFEDKIYLKLKISKNQRKASVLRF